MADDTEIALLTLARSVRQWADLLSLPPDVHAALRQADAVIHEKRIAERVRKLGVANGG